MQCAADQKATHLRFAEIVDERVPIAVYALARIGVLVERGAIEPREPMCVGRKMRWDPIEQYAESRRVTALDETTKAGGIAVTRSGCVQADGLVTP